MNTPNWTSDSPTNEGFYWIAYLDNKRVYEVKRHNGGLKVVTHAPPSGASGMDKSKWAIPEQLRGAQWFGPIDVPPDP